MYYSINYKTLSLALALAASAACGSPLNRSPNPSAANANDGNPTANANQTIPLDPNALKCTTNSITGAKLSNCVCSTENNEICPQYAANANAMTAPWTCTAISVSGGLFYSCQCDTTHHHRMHLQPTPPIRRCHVSGDVRAQRGDCY